MYISRAASTAVYLKIKASAIYSNSRFGWLAKFSTHPHFISSLRSPFSSPTLISNSLSGSQEKPFHTTAIYQCWTTAEAPKMTVTATPCIVDGCLTVNGKVLSTGVPPNIVVIPTASGSAFLGANSSVSSSRHVFSLGVLQECKFLSLFRFKIWWMIPRVGKLGREIPEETQMLLLELREESALRRDNDDEKYSNQKNRENVFYVVLLPVLEGPFRASLQGTPSNELEFCVESGDTSVQTTQVSEAVFVNSGDKPFELIKNSMKIIEMHKGTFTCIEHKKIPSHLDWFGWCTWDAFYKDVNPQGIKEGLQSLLEGGCPAKFLIIDDGWQETVNEFVKDNEPFIEGTQFATRLVDIKENRKFKGSLGDTSHDLHDFIKLLKEKYGLKFVYMWHALVGYWGGLDPSSEKTKKYNPKIEYPIQSPSSVANLRDVAMDSLEKYGVGVIDPEKIYDFYNDLHSYLAKRGVDGVKVDVQNVLETLGSRHGGRVCLTRRYQEALEQSIVTNFKENNLICCMSHNSDSIYSSKRSAVARASEDFMPRELTFQTLHVASVAFNSLLLGEIVVPDWDMFQSKHSMAEFHGAARAVGGCAVYVSDKPGMHDFKVLKKLVLPDGSVLRARHHGRPTRDCLFTDPVMDGKSLLKIWNLNKLSGVVGAFNCQGAGDWPLKERSEEITVSISNGPISAQVSPLDVEYIGEVAGESWSGDCVIYAFHSGSLTKLLKEGQLEVALRSLECEIFSISPIRVVNQSIRFAPLGLIDMYNSGGANEALSYTVEPSGARVRVKARGCGHFGAYSSMKPGFCMVDGKEERFDYNTQNGLLTLKLEEDDDCGTKEIEFVY